MVSKNITFYSYKGGLGRSLALINVATILAQRGKNVACLDYDIEAPGLHNFFKLSNNSIKTGLLELLKSDNISNFKEYIIEKNELGLEFPGNFYLLPCEPSIDKLKKISFNPVDPLGTQVFEDAKDFPKMIGELLSLDYVFVDSRTGYTDPTIASFLACEIIVVFFRFNKQNLDGINDLLRTFKFNLKGKRILLCASSIPQISSLNEKRQFFEKELGEDIDFVIPYDPELEFDEKICIIDMPDSNCTKVYNEFVDLLEEI